ncbi:MAG: amino acid ABC transporter permease [Rhodospirillales bacterium]|nr:amino acid ABC transporter permease [Rhodospirillales bacterium]
MLHRLGALLDPALFWEYRVILLKGLAVDGYVFLASATLAVLLAFAIAIARLGRNTLLRALATAYAEFFRNTPEYILLVWVYYVVPVLLGQLLATKVDISPYVASVLALGLAYSGFLSETVRAGILSVPRGQIEAALSLGLRRFQILQRIILPQALRRMLPEALNQFVSLFKATSFVSLVAVPDIMYQVSMIDTQEMRPIPLYTGAAVLYCVVIICASQSIQHLSERWRRRGWA